MTKQYLTDSILYFLFRLRRLAWLQEKRTPQLSDLFFFKQIKTNIAGVFCFELVVLDVQCIIINFLSLLL